MLTLLVIIPKESGCEDAQERPILSTSLPTEETHTLLHVQFPPLPTQGHVAEQTITGEVSVLEEEFLSPL